MRHFEADPPQLGKIINGLATYHTHLLAYQKARIEYAQALRDFHGVRFQYRGADIGKQIDKTKAILNEKQTAYFDAMAVAKDAWKEVKHSVAVFTKNGRW